MTPLRSLLCLLLVAAPALGTPALAQTATGGASPSATPATGLRSHSYLGLSLGRSSYSLSCPTTSLTCDDSDTAIRVYGGAMMGDHWGVEIGYLDLGRIAREGGQTKAQGLNLSLVGKAPLLSSFGIFGRLGTTYGRTETSASSAAIAAGTEKGFGLSYGAGLSYDFTPRLSATLQWDSNDFRFSGGAREPVRSTSLGLQYRY
jgi:OmpA-OmpF porin, OOP family